MDASFQFRTGDERERFKIEFQAQNFVYRVSVDNHWRRSREV